MIEFIRNKIIPLAHLKWTMHFGWVNGHARIEGNELVGRLAKGHAGIEGNELVDRLAKGHAGIEGNELVDRLAKGHMGIEGNELVGRLAKEAAVEDGPVVYDKMPREVIIAREKENGLHMWQRQWTNTGKGTLTILFVPPSVRKRL